MGSKHYVLVLGLLFLAAFSGGLSAVFFFGHNVNAQEEAVHVGTVTARELRMVDRAGKTALTITAEGMSFKDGDRTNSIVTSRFISLSDKEGISDKEGMTVISPSGVTIGSHGKWRAALTVDPDPALIITDAAERERIRLTMKTEGAGLSLRNNMGETKIRLAAEESENAFIAFYDKSARHVASLSVFKNQGGVLITNPDGKPIWSAP